MPTLSCQISKLGRYNSFLGPLVEDDPVERATQVTVFFHVELDVFAHRLARKYVETRELGDAVQDDLDKLYVETGTQEHKHWSASL